MGKKTRKSSNVNSNFSNFTPFENVYMWFLDFILIINTFT